MKKFQRGPHNDYQGGGKPRPYFVTRWEDQGGGKPRPYPAAKRVTNPCRVRAGLAPALAHTTYRVRAGACLALKLSRLLFIAFFLCVAFIMLTTPMSHKALAQGNTFIVTILGSSQPPGFAPGLLTVHVYDTVVFVNATNAPVAVVAVDASFSSPAIAPGKLWQVTLNSAGAFEYHENSATPRLVGEIVVVPNSVALLPSPAPAAQETAIAYMKAGKTPPDTVWQPPVSQVAPTGETRPAKNHTATTTLTVPPLALLMTFVRPVIVIVVILLALFTTGLGGLWLYRRRKSRENEDDEDEDEDE